MSVLVIGGDRLGNIKDKLKESGFDKINHVTGRKKRERKIKIPEKTDVVLVLIDFVGHNLTEIIKEESKRTDVKVLFAKRSWVHMKDTIDNYVENISLQNKE